MLMSFLYVYSSHKSYFIKILFLFWTSSSIFRSLQFHSVGLLQCSERNWVQRHPGSLGGRANNTSRRQSRDCNHLWLHDQQGDRTAIRVADKSMWLQKLCRIWCRVRPTRSSLHNSHNPSVTLAMLKVLLTMSTFLLHRVAFHFWFYY